MKNLSLRSAIRWPVGVLLSLLPFLFTSCDRRLVQGEEATELIVEFRIGDEALPTRASGVPVSGEGQVNRWALCVYRLSDGMLAAFGSSSSSSSISKTLPAGEYRAVALVNAPVSGSGFFDPSANLTEAGLGGQVAFLSDNAAGSLEMYGHADFSLERNSVSVPIPVSRLVSKVVLRKLSLRLSDAGLAAYPFTLSAVYLDNVPSRTNWGRDLSYDELWADRSFWYNAMGWHAAGSCPSPACPDALLGDQPAGTVIAQGQSLVTDYVYYTLPNATTDSQDTRSGHWDKRATRLVIEARIGPQVQYYVATLPGMARNRSYVIEEAVITGLGAADPETETPNSLELLFSLADAGWEDGGTIIL